MVSLIVSMNMEGTDNIYLAKESTQINDLTVLSSEINTGYIYNCHTWYNGENGIYLLRPQIYPCAIWTVYMSFTRNPGSTAGLLRRNAYYRILSEIRTALNVRFEKNGQCTTD